MKNADLHLVDDMWNSQIIDTNITDENALNVTKIEFHEQKITIILDEWYKSFLDEKNDLLTIEIVRNVMIDVICFVFSDEEVSHTLDSSNCFIVSNYLLKIDIEREVIFVSIWIEEACSLSLSVLFESRSTLLTWSMIQYILSLL